MSKDLAMTQQSEFLELQRKWAENGNQSCAHPSIDKEYIMGSSTGDDGCLVCGATWWRG